MPDQQPSKPRAILHVDMDAFYASVEQRDHPELRGKPVIVGGIGQRGVVAAASYEVRTYGVHSAMPMREALRRCPHALCVRPRFERYRAVSEQVFAVFREFTPLVQGLSLDEAFLDVTDSQVALGTATAIAARIKALIATRTQLTASVGVAANKLLAKIASDLRKPDGLMVIIDADIHAVLDPLSVRKLAGIGPKTAAQLEQIGIVTLGQLRVASEATLQPLFGRYAARIKERAAGIDDRPVLDQYDEKQISAETTFDVDLSAPHQLHGELARLADRMGERLRRSGWVANRVVLKIRRRDFRTFTRQARVRPATQATQPLARAAAQLLDQWLDANRGASVRLLGIGATDLSKAPQLDMFEVQQAAREQRLDHILDDIRSKFGAKAVGRASSLPPRR